MRRTLMLLSTMVVALLLASGVALAATFTNSSSIQIVDDGPANPYPSQINVQNLSGNISDVDLKLSGYSHVFPDDVGVLVVGPQGQKVLVMSDVGFTCDVSGIDLTFDDEATSSLPNGCAITAGTYKPTQGTAQSGEGSQIDANFPSPAPAGPYGTQLSDFDGTDPNGTWSLYVFDDTDVETGQIANGWSLEITTADNQEPTAADDSYTTNEDTTLTEAAPGVLTNDEDADGDPLTADLVDDVDNGTLTLNSDGSFTYTPNANFSGSDSFTYKANDGSADSNEATVSISVTAANDTPTVTVDRGGSCGSASDMRGTINLALLDSDDPPESLTLTATSSNRSVLPNRNISFGGGTDASRTMTVSSLTGSGTSTVTVTVSDEGDLTGTVVVRVISGSAANNTLTGSANADMIFGRKGSDTASAQGANDLLCGGNGNDRLTGGPGADHFGGGSGTDTATDFNAGEGDTMAGIP